MVTNAQAADIPLEKSLDNCAIIIPFKDNHFFTIKCLRSIVASALSSTLPKIYLVDNNSERSETLDAVKTIIDEYPDDIQLLSYSQPFNFSAINNFAVRQCAEKYIFFVNNDIEVLTPGLFEAGIQCLENKEIGAIGFELLYADNTIQHSGIRINSRNNPFHELLNHPSSNVLPQNAVHQTIACTGALLGLKRDIFISAGCFDENLPVSYNDVDLCHSVSKLGLKIVVNRFYKAYHYESKTRQLDSENNECRARLLNDRRKLHEKHANIYMPALVNPSQIKSGRSLNEMLSSNRLISSQNLIQHGPLFKVSFVSTTRQKNVGLDPSIIYRCINPAKYIYSQIKYSKCNVISSAQLVDNFQQFAESGMGDDLLDDFFSSNVVVFHRPSFSPELMQIVSRLKGNGCKIFADYDDFVFDIGEYKNSSAGQQIDSASKDIALLNTFSLNQSALSLFDQFIVSTTELKHELQKTLKHTFNKSYDIHVIPNTPSTFWMSYADVLFNKSSKEKKRVVNTSRLGYFGGTASHSKDFQLVHQWVYDFLASNPQNQFIYCKVAFNQLFPKNFNEQIKSFAPVTYNKLPSIYNLSWLNIAPLSPSSFNQCKSGLKYFESALFGLPVCATPIPDIHHRFEEYPLLFVLDTYESILHAQEESKLLYSHFDQYLEAWNYVLQGLKTENKCIQANFLQLIMA